MRIAVLNNAVPFVRGGAEYLAEWLTDRLRRFGHSATLIRVPFRWDPPERILESMLACKLMVLQNCDRVIALKFPVYLIEHETKVLWLLHQFRQAYDLWGTPLQFLPDDEQGTRIRKVIRRSDNEVLSKVSKVYTLSRVTSERLMHFNGVASQVLFHPLQTPEQYHCEAYEDYIFCPARMNEAKRQHLLVESMAFTRTDARLIIAGRAEDPRYLERIRERVERLGVGDRVQIVAEFILEADKASLFSRALGCAYIPYDEDSYGYVTMEAFQSRKPVITCSDSGGIDILVHNEKTGFIVAPEPSAIAAAIDRLYADRLLAKEMGQAAYELLLEMEITWENVIARLTA